jgi:homoserine O-acetyltransferase
MRRRLQLLLGFVVAHFGQSALCQTPNPPRIASLGTCTLTGGSVIPNCRIAYRVFGRLNPARTNAVVIPTWLLGRSEDWISLLGPDKWIDTTRFYAIIVDAFANGRSSSPSNTVPESGAAFRDLTIADMVEAQHRFVVENLKLPRLHAVVGISMGGMQAFEWAVKYPTFVDVVIPIVGSPQIGSFDHTLWTTQLSEIENGLARGTSADSIWTQLSRISVLFLRTPRAVNKGGRDSTAADIASSTDYLRHNWNLQDYASQLRAVLRQNVAARFGGDLTRAAAEVRAPMLIVFSWDDHMVTADAAVAFANYVRADTLSLHSACGHLAPACDEARASAVVRQFLAR